MTLSLSQSARPHAAPGSVLAVLATATAIGSLGLAAGGSAGALVAEEMTGSTAWAGVPLGLLVAGSAASALAISRRASRAGRAAGLVLGYGVGTAGAVIVILAAVLDDLALLLAGSAALGSGNAAIFLTRYAAADQGRDGRRGTALGIVLFATAAGAVAGPNLLGPSGDLAQGLGLPRLSGLYLVAVAAYVTAAGLLAAVPRSPVPVVSRAVTRREIRAGVERARAGIIALAATNLVMVAVMAIAPVHLTAHGHGLGAVGVVIGVHVACMFAPSPLTGRLADRVGGAAVAALGAVLLAAAGLGGALVDLTDGLAVGILLAVLGLGWNAGVVGGSTMLAGSVPAALRPRTEGIGEVAMGLAAGAGAPVAGVLAAFGDFALLWIAGALVGALMLLALRGGRAPHRPGAEPLVERKPS